MRITRLEDGGWAAIDDTLVIRTAYQPVFRCKGERLLPVAFEALARPYRGAAQLMPANYFAALPRERLAVVEGHLRHIHVRNATHLPAGARRLFLNIHPAALDGQSAIDEALTALGADLRLAGIAPPDVVCEITEQRERPGDALKDLVYAMRARGYRVAVDDFGAAFADPERIARLTPDIVKIDGHLVRRYLSTSAGFGEIARIVATFSRQGIQCVLEGLETLDQVEMARLTGAHFLQGFALGAPRLAPDSFDALMRAGRAGPTTTMVKTIR